MAATPPHRAASWIAFGLSALAALMGAGALALDSSFAARDARLETWVPVEATIETSTLRDTSYRDPDDGLWVRRSAPAVAYVYRVNGVQYRSTTINATTGGVTGKPEAVIARYPVGARVTAYHDPANPSEATLSRTPEMGFPVATVMGVLTLLASVGLAALGVRLRRAR